MNCSFKILITFFCHSVVAFLLKFSVPMILIVLNDCCIPEFYLKIENITVNFSIFISIGVFLLC